LGGAQAGKQAFVGNFQGTYVRPENSLDLKSCKQESGEFLWDYIRRFLRQSNSLPDIVDIDVVSEFLIRTTCKPLVHKLGCRKPRTTRELLDITMNHASGQEGLGMVFTDGQTMGKAKRVEQDEGPATMQEKKKRDRRCPCDSSCTCNLGT
jgi:hypothetical protein